jgi:hypothetical protein
MNIDFFYYINDIITTNYKNIIKNYKKKLPDIFYNDIPILEIKDEYKKEIINIPLLSKFKEGSYETSKSSSDHKIVKDISFFVNNLPSFKKYKDDNDLSYLIDNHRLFTYELLEFYSKKDISLRTIENRFVALLRVFFIAYNDKQYELYKKYTYIVKELNNIFTVDEDKQQLNKREKNAYIPFEIIIEFQKYLLKNSSTSYNENQDLLLISLYRYLPERNELKLLNFIKEEDYVIIENDSVKIMLNLVKKKHNEIEIDLIEEDLKELNDIIINSYNLYPRKYLFTDYNNINKKMSIQGLSRRLTNMFSFTGKKIGVNSIRSSFLTYLNKTGTFTLYDKKKYAKLLRTRPDKIDANYIKIIPEKEEHKIIQDIINAINNKNKNIDKNKLYKKNHYETNKRKVIINRLNMMENYKDKVRKKTFLKYDIKKNDIGLWI